MHGTQSGNPASAAGPPTPVAPVIGTVDLELVFKSYEKVKDSNKEYSAALMARKNELMRIMAEAQEEAQMLSKLAPGTEDYKKHENRVTELKARHEAGREQAEREFAQRQAEAMATLYKEIQEMVKKVAQWRKMNYVVKVSNQPITGTDPNSVMAAISSTLVYADPRNDITNDVIYNLNRFYKATAAPRPSPPLEVRPLLPRPAPRILARRTETKRFCNRPASEDRAPEPAANRPARRWPLQQARRPPPATWVAQTASDEPDATAGSGGAMKGHGMLRATRPERTSPARRKCVDSVFSTGPTSRFDLARPTPALAWSSCGPTCPVDRRCPRASTW